MLSGEPGLCIDEVRIEGCTLDAFNMPRYAIRANAKPAKLLRFPFRVWKEHPTLRGIKFCYPAELFSQNNHSHLAQLL